MDMKIVPPPAECGYFIGNSPCNYSVDSLQPGEVWIDYQSVCVGQGSRFHPGDYTLSLSVSGHSFLERPARPNSPWMDIPLRVVECPSHESEACSLAYLGWKALWQGKMDCARAAWGELVTNFPESKLAPRAAWSKWNSDKLSIPQDSSSLSQWYEAGLNIMQSYPLSPECVSVARFLINGKGLAYIQSAIREIERNHPSAPVLQERLIQREGG